jgi:hypothetical protein
MRPGDIHQAAVACQMAAAIAHFMSTMNGHIKDRRQSDTVWWQDRAAHWSGVARCLMAIDEKDEDFA